MVVVVVCGGIVMDVIGLRSECGGGLDIWVWGGGLVQLRCRSGLLGCWLHPLDAQGMAGVGLFGGGWDLLALLLRFIAFGCGSVRGCPEEVFPPLCGVASISARCRISGYFGHWGRCKDARTRQGCTSDPR